MKKLIILALLLVAGKANAGSNWEVLHKINPMTNELKTYTLAESVKPGGLLVVRCLQGSFEALYFSANQYFADEGYVMTARVDKEVPEEFYAEGVGDQVLFVATPENITERAKRGKVLLISASGYDKYRELVRVFSLEGAKEAISAVEAACD